MHVQNAFHTICTDMLKKKDIPDYKLIIETLDNAIKKVHGNRPGKPKFEWL